MIRLFLIVVNCFCFLSGFAGENGIQKSLNEMSLPRKFNGVILVADDKQIYYQKALGFEDHEKKIPITLDTQFRAGSITKQMTAALILQQVENGALSLHAPISSYLPDLKAPWAKEVTIHHLLTHTSGIVSEDKPLALEPGKIFAYSNLGYELLGRILEKTLNLPLSDVFQDLLQKANMEESFFVNEPISLRDLKINYPKLALGYNEIEYGAFLEEKGLFDPSHNASAGVFTTALDLLKWNRALFSGEIIESLDLMLFPSTTRSHRYSKDLKYGYGVQILQEDGITEISHSGYVDGYCSTLLYYPEDKLTVIVLENTAWASSDLKRVFRVQDIIRWTVRMGELSSIQP